MRSADDARSDRLIESLLAGEPAALARAISAVESQDARATAILRAIQPHRGRAAVVGFTGAPGVGKSTLIDAYTRELRRRGRSVGIVAVDPTSPITGGAILGDRIRMNAQSGDPEVFVRSIASRGHLGGLFETAAQVIDVMDASGRDVILVETVGAGQSEVEVAEIANVRVVICAPGLGDEIQTMKAGILEIADILVVNKSDMPLAPQTARHLEAMVGLAASPAGAIPVVSTVATSGEGVAALADAIEARAAVNSSDGRGIDPKLRTQRLLAAVAGRLLQRRLEAADDPALDAICEAVERGEIDLEAAAERVAAVLLAPTAK
jgi:LAO/AO transport system kinase